MKSVPQDQLALPTFETLPPTAPPKSEKRQRSNAMPEQCHDRVLRRLDVQLATGLTRTAIYRLIAANDFPQQVRLSTNTVGWLSSEVHAWITSRVAASRPAAINPSTKARR